ncbi:MAG: hypothetical protein HUU38_05000 [Anaerolineales bacterium]|nr:hypothetical protein [Anaerolineales bacterium]
MKKEMTPLVNRCACERCRSELLYPEKQTHHQFNLLMSRLNEQQRRWLAGWEAARIGWGGIRLMAEVTGLSAKTIRRGMRELEEGLKGRPMRGVRRCETVFDHQ